MNVYVYICVFTVVERVHWKALCMVVKPGPRKQVQTLVAMDTGYVHSRHVT